MIETAYAAILMEQLQRHVDTYEHVEHLSKETIFEILIQLSARYMDE
jgi:hypothetical protein